MDGPGLRETRKVNISLMEKLIWYILCSPDKPWVEVMKHKIFNEGSFFIAKKGDNQSYAWRGILKTLDHLHDGFEPRCYKQQG